MAEAEVQRLIARFAAAHEKLLGSVRRRMRKLLPTAYEMVYEYKTWIVISYSPSGRGFEGVFAIRADAAGVQFYFNQGKELPDPEKLLQGSGKQVRFIELASISTLSRPAVARLIDDALAHNSMPFAAAGRGAVIIQSAKAK